MIKKILNWFRASLEGTDGKAEETKIGGYIILGLIIWATKHIIALGAAVTMTQIYLLAILLVFYLLLNGVIKFQEIIEGIKNIKHD